jgi:hypothetical protein
MLEECDREDFIIPHPLYIGPNNLLIVEAVLVKHLFIEH